MLRICISGLTCTGKTTIGEKIAKELNLLHITKTITLTHQKVKSEMQSNKDGKLKVLETADARYAKAFDDETVQLAKDNNCVVTTWLGPWVVKDATLRVWLYAPNAERIKRWSKRHETTIEDATVKLAEKDMINTAVFKELYGIDLNDHSDFDMEINTGKLNNQEVISLISMLAISKEKQEFR
jgi:CMP/dCMP kinase